MTDDPLHDDARTAYLFQCCGGEGPSNSSLARDVDRQKLDAGLLDRLRIELHQLHHLDRHTDLDGSPSSAASLAVSA